MAIDGAVETTWEPLSSVDYFVLGFVGVMDMLALLICAHLLWYRKWPPYVTKNVNLVVIATFSGVLWSVAMANASGFWRRRSGDILAACDFERFLSWSTLCVHTVSFFIRVYRLWRILIKHADNMWHTEHQILLMSSLSLIPVVSTWALPHTGKFDEVANTCSTTTISTAVTLGMDFLGFTAICFLWFVCARQLKGVRRQFNEYDAMKRTLSYMSVTLLSYAVVVIILLADDLVTQRRVSIFYPMLTTYILLWGPMKEPITMKMLGDNEYLMSYTKGFSELPSPAQLKASLAEQLSVDQLRTEFRRYIKTKVAQELIDFYLDSLNREEVLGFFERQAVTMRIVMRYIREGSPDQVNISEECREKVLATDVTAYDIFDDARAEVLEVMETNFRRDFIATEGFRRIVDASHEKQMELRRLRAEGMILPNTSPDESSPVRESTSNVRSHPEAAPYQSQSSFMMLVRGVRSCGSKARARRVAGVPPHVDGGDVRREHALQGQYDTDLDTDIGRSTVNILHDPATRHGAATRHVAHPTTNVCLEDDQVTRGGCARGERELEEGQPLRAPRPTYDYGGDDDVEDGSSAVGENEVPHTSSPPSNAFLDSNRNGCPGRDDGDGGGKKEAETGSPHRNGRNVHDDAIERRRSMETGLDSMSLSASRSNSVKDTTNSEETISVDSLRGLGFSPASHRSAAGVDNHNGLMNTASPSVSFQEGRSTLPNRSSVFTGGRHTSAPGATAALRGRGIASIQNRQSERHQRTFDHAQDRNQGENLARQSSQDSQPAMSPIILNAYPLSCGSEEAGAHKPSVHPEPSDQSGEDTSCSSHKSGSTNGPSPPGLCRLGNTRDTEDVFGRIRERQPTVAAIRPHAEGVENAHSSRFDGTNSGEGLLSEEVVVMPTGQLGALQSPSQGFEGVVTNPRARPATSSLSPEAPSRSSQPSLRSEASLSDEILTTRSAALHPSEDRADDLGILSPTTPEDSPEWMRFADWMEQGRQRASSRGTESARSIYAARTGDEDMEAAGSRWDSPQSGWSHHDELSSNSSSESSPREIVRGGAGYTGGGGAPPLLPRANSFQSWSRRLGRLLAHPQEAWSRGSTFMKG